MTKAKSCPQGKYWCFDDKKCKKIPLGYHIGLRGYLYPDEQDNGTDNGNGNSNGNGSNGNGTSGNGNGGGVSEMKENFKRINSNGQTYAVMLSFRGRTYNIQMFIPKQTRPTRLEVEQEVNKIYPGAIVRYFEPRVWDPTNPALIMPESMQPGAKDLVQQSDYMKPALQQKKNVTNHKKKKHTCGEGVTLKKVSEVFDHKIDAKKFKKDKRDAKIGNLARKTTNPGEKRNAEKFSKGPKLFGEDSVKVEGKYGYVEFIDLIKPEPMKGIAERTLTKGEDDKKEKSFGGFREETGIGPSKKERIEKSDKIQNPNKYPPTGLWKLVLDKVKENSKNTNGVKEQLAPHIKKGVAAARPLVKANVLQAGLPTKEKPKTPEKKDSKSVFKQLTNKDEID